MDKLDVLALHSTVMIGEHGNVKATITGITIRPNRVLYEVQYWEGSTLIELQLESFQFSHDASPKMLKVNLSLS